MKEATEAPQLELSWGAVASKGRRHTEATLSNKDTTVAIMILAVLHEPLRALARYYMECSLRNPYTAYSDWPTILNLLNPAASILTASLQYYSTLLASPADCHRLILVMAQRSCTTYEQWAREWPDDVQLLRRGALCIIASLERRQYKYLVDKFGVLSAGDWRLSEDTRRAIAKQVITKADCCAHHGLPRGIRRHAYRTASVCQSCPVDQVYVDDAVAALLEFGNMLILIGAYIRLSIAFVENIHKMHRTISIAGRSTLDMLTAMSICSRARQRHTDVATRRDEKTKSSGAQLQQPSVAASIAPFSHVRRALSPFEVFKKQKENCWPTNRLGRSGTQSQQRVKTTWPTSGQDAALMRRPLVMRLLPAQFPSQKRIARRTSK